MDTPIEEEKKRLKERLKKIENNDSSVVFTCPECGKKYKNLLNYDRLGMCGKCFKESAEKRMYKKVKHLIGGEIVDVKVEEVSPFILTQDKPITITEIEVKTKEGKVKLAKVEEPMMIV